MCECSADWRAWRSGTIEVQGRGLERCFGLSCAVDVMSTQSIMIQPFASQLMLPANKKSVTLTYLESWTEYEVQVSSIYKDNSYGEALTGTFITREQNPHTPQKYLFLSRLCHCTHCLHSFPPCFSLSCCDLVQQISPRKRVKLSPR